MRNDIPKPEARAGSLQSAGSASLLPTSRCPVCRYEMDSATCASKKDEEASAGDVSVCLNCGEMLQFNDILVLKPLPPEQLASLPAEPKALLMRASELIKQRGRIR
jgi:hypothetical protein